MSDGSSIGADSSACAFVSSLLAGGSSSRMGRDKALLSVAGRPMGLRQCDVLRALGPTISVVAPQRPSWTPADICWICDTPGVEGPLAGLSAALEWAQTMNATHLVALAVDLPQMDSSTLCGLMRQATPGQGAVPQIGKSYEPLAAVYPVHEALVVARSFASKRCWKLQSLVAELAKRGSVKAIPASDPSAFYNINTPQDFASLLIRPRRHQGYF